MRNTKILASIDLHPDTFQPFVSIQTSVLALQRKTQEQIDLETAGGQISDYEIFMAVANHVGTTSAGNTHMYVTRKATRCSMKQKNRSGNLKTAFA